MSVRMEKVESHDTCLVSASELRGYHFGMEIHHRRRIAVKVSARVLDELIHLKGVLIKKVRGGDKLSTIPRESTRLCTIQKTRGLIARIVGPVGAATRTGI
jgi:hypothetical protein